MGDDGISSSYSCLCCRLTVLAVSLSVVVGENPQLPPLTAAATVAASSVLIAAVAQVLAESLFGVRAKLKDQLKVKPLIIRCIR